MKKYILIKAILLWVLFSTFAYVVGEGYPVQEALLTVLFLFGVCLVALPLFVYRDIKYKTARIVCGAVLVAITAYYSFAMQEFFKFFGLCLLGILSIVVIYSPIIALVAYIYWSIRH